MENCIVFRLCDEDRARLDAIIDALGNKPNCSKCMETVTEAVAAHVTKPVPATEPEAHPVNDPFPEPIKEEPQPEPAPEPAAEPEPEPVPEPVKEEEPAPAVTLEQIQQKVIKLATSGKKDQVREIVNAHAKKVSDLPAEVWGEVWTKLTELETEG